MSANELNWPGLLQLLKQEVDNEEISLAAVEELNWVDKCRLVQAAPVTCARHFSHLVHCLEQTVFSVGRQGVLGPVVDITLRIEFQQRGD